MKSSQSNLRLSSTQDVWTQDNDCCDDGSCGQSITILTEDGGGGPYLVIKTDRWAFDSVAELVAILEPILKRAEGAAK